MGKKHITIYRNCGWLNQCATSEVSNRGEETVGTGGGLLQHSIGDQQSVQTQVLLMKTSLCIYLIGFQSLF